MDGLYIIQNHKTMHKKQIKPFSPKTKPWTLRTKPWTHFQDLYILGDFSNPKQKWQELYFLALKCVCVIQNKNTNT